MNQSDEDLTKVTLNIFTADYKELNARYQTGYSVAVRMIVRNHLRRLRDREKEVCGND